MGNRLDYVQSESKSQVSQVAAKETMKAMRFHEFGGPEVLNYEDAPKPVPRLGEALIKVKAASLNHIALWPQGTKKAQPVEKRKIALSLK